MMIDAVVRQFEIIGEAAGKLSSDFRDANPEIPVRDMIDMRNILIHNYAGVNTKIIWDTYLNDIADLEESLRKCL